MNAQDILNGACDTHIHFGPDVLPRKMTALETARAAAQAGMRAIMLKSHVTPTYPVAACVSEVVPEVAVFGGLVCNAATGGINAAAVRAACVMGAKQIWMPTVSSRRHLSHFREDGLCVHVFDAQGRPAPALEDILRSIAAADIILGTGHLAPEETQRLAGMARECGVKKILVTHPEFEAVAMPVAMQKALAAEGVCFERCFYASNSAQKLPVQAVADEIMAVGYESTVLASDFGQRGNPPPVDGLRDFARQLEACGIPRRALECMLKETPARLLGL